MREGNRFSFSDVEHEALLLVEGIDDARFVAAFLGRLRTTAAVQIAQVGGKNNFRPFLKGTLKRAQHFFRLRRLGLIGDADTNASAEFQRLCGALTAAELPAPTQAWSPIQQEELSVSVAILPDMTSPGNLEALCLRSLGGTPALLCIDEYVDCITRVSPPIAAHQLAKAKVHTYLAAGAILKQDGGQAGQSTVRTAPGLRLGEAAERGVWDWDSSAFKQLKDWLCELAS